MSLLELFKPIRTFVFETEGVLSDSIWLLSERGERIYRIDSRDIYALRTAVTKGYKIWLVTDGKDEWLNELRTTGMSIINRNMSGYENIFQDVLQSHSEMSALLYMGSELPAYENMYRFGLPVCPGNAAPEIKKVAKYISPCHGGNGCVRDVIEKVLKLNGHWFAG